MSYNPFYNLTGKKVSDTYHWLLQSGSDGLIYDGDGNSVTINATIPNIYVLTSSFNSFTSSYTTGSFTGSFTGSLLGTASYAANGGVTQLLAGPNITLSPTDGLGQVTITSTGGGGGTGNTATGSYGSFYDTTTQTNPVGNVPRSMSFNTTAITNGVSISGSTSPFNTYIKTENPGVYNLQFSAQLDKTDSGTDEIVIWLRKNGVDLIDTATTISLVGNNSKNVAAWNWFVNSAANDYYQIIWYSPDTAIRLLAEVAGGGHPGIPSVIATVDRVDQFLSNTGSFTGSFTGAFTGSLLGTSSQATSASYALTASYVPYTPGANITASFTNLSTWTFNHNLNNQGVIVQTYDLSWNQIVPQNITLTSTNTATITFPTNESGYAIASLGGLTLNAVSSSYATISNNFNVLTTVDATNPLDLTKQVQKLSAENYTLQNGSEGQIMYFTLKDDVDYTSTTITIDAARYIRIGAKSEIVIGSVWTPFDGDPTNTDATFQIPTIATAIFTDGAWNISTGGTLTY